MKIPEGRLKREWCGPASIRIAAGYLGLVVDEAKLAEKIYDPEWGMDGEAMLRGVATLGLYGAWVKDKDLSVLAKMVKLGDYQVILSWIVGEDKRNDGHYSVLLDADKERVNLADPDWIGSIKIMDRKRFESVWFDYTEDGDRQEKYALVISR